MRDKKKSLRSQPINFTRNQTANVANDSKLYSCKMFNNTKPIFELLYLAYFITRYFKSPGDYFHDDILI